VEFFALDQATDDAWIALSGDGTNDAKFDVDYAAAGLAATNAFTADSTVLSGDDVTVTFSVVDQYGEPMSSSAKGAAYSIELAAADTDDLELFAAVVDGEAAFTFANFVGAGSSEVLTAKLFTGANTSPSYVAGQSEQMTLYNTNTVAGVNITDEDISTTVGYEDFITGLASSTNVAPTASADTLSGTVVDSNGAGIPGAPVVISGEGFQFLKTNGTSYSVDSISLNTDEAGFWSVDMWTHSASTTGKDNLITVTSGTASGTIEVIAALAASISGGNLVMSWDLPSNPVYNTTYAVTGRVVDVWGNPVSGVNLDFAGEAAAEFNAKASVDKNTNTSGEATVYLRSLKDVSGLAAVSMTAATGTRTLTDAGGLLTDVVGTSWDESSWVNPISQEITFLTSAVVASADQKVNVGSFKGFVALYAKGYEGQKMSAIVAGKWIVVESLASDFERVVRFTGAGYTITTKLYIDGEQVGDAFTTLTK
jgi:protocatechuate 3,4-dioxygenase beta subunit